MFEHTHQLRVRYAETDQMAYVYYGNYATYYEVGRVETLRQLGISYKSLEDMGVMMPVVENKSRYILPGKYDDVLTIKVSIPTPPSVKIVFNYEISNESGQIINTGETILVFVDMSTNKVCRMPEIMVKLLQPFFDDQN